MVSWGIGLCNGWMDGVMGEVDGVIHHWYNGGLDGVMNSIMAGIMDDIREEADGVMGDRSMK